jgi:hypothetical protein
MTIKTLNLTRQWDYASVYDDARDEEGKVTAEATVFTLKQLDSRVVGQLRDSATSFVQADPTRIDSRPVTTINTHEANFKRVQFGCIGWRNMHDDAGNDIEFKTVKRSIGNSLYDVVDPDVLRLVPGEVIDELAIQIHQGQIVTKDEAKNSSAPSSP